MTRPPAPPAARRTPARRPAPVRAADGGLGSAVRVAVGFTIAIWAVFLINTVVFGGALDWFGVRPRDPEGLWGILAAPLLHADYGHLSANTGPAAVFAGLIAFSSRRLWRRVTLIVALASGLGAWLFGAAGDVHIGASGLIYGWLAFLLVRGLYNRAPGQILLGAALAAGYSGMVWGVFPTTMGVSWQMHLFGALGGILAAALLRPRRRPGPRRTLEIR